MGEATSHDAPSAATTPGFATCQACGYKHRGYVIEVEGEVLDRCPVCDGYQWIPEPVATTERLGRKRAANRAWHHKRRDGQCEAITLKGTRCVFVGQYDGLSGEVRCGIHAW